MESSRSLVNDHSSPALGLMLASIFWASFIPVAVVLLDPREFPFVFNAIWRLGSSLFCALVFFLYAIRLGPGWLPRLWSLRRRLVSWPVFFLTLGSMDFGFFALAIRCISPPVASVLLESYVLPGVLLLLLGLRGRYSDSPFLLAFLLPFSLLGVVFLTASEYGGFREVFSGVLVGRVGPLWGVGISLLAALILALGFLVFRWSEEVGLELSRMEGGSERRRELVVLALFASLLVCNVLSALLSLGVGLMLGEPLPRPGLVALMLLVGFVVHGPPVFGWRLGVILGRYAGIGVLIHVSTLLTLGWYWLLSLAAVSHLGYLAVGVLDGRGLRGDGPGAGVGVGVAALALQTGREVAAVRAGWLWLSGSISPSGFSLPAGLFESPRRMPGRVGLGLDVRLGLLHLGVAGGIWIHLPLL